MRAASEALLCRDRTVPLSETGTWDSLPKVISDSPFTTSRVAAPRSHGLTFLRCRTSRPPKPLERRCVLTPTLTHTYTDKLLVYTPPHSPLLQVSLVKLPSHEVYQAKESRDNIKTHKECLREILKLTRSSRYLCGWETETKMREGGMGW